MFSLDPIFDDKTGEIVLYDIWVKDEQDVKWHGSRRTREQCDQYLSQINGACPN